MLPPESAHALTLAALRAIGRFTSTTEAEAAPPSIRLAGLELPNRVGLAAGFDKDGLAVDGLRRLGFGFIEIGTVTPKPQPGNVQRPRVIRIPGSGAIINRLGFPSAGAAVVAARLSRLQRRGILGVNIGKNATTRNEQAVDDYVSCFEALHAHADYVAINVSSPNTPQLRELQRVERLQSILEALLEARARSRTTSSRPLPFFLKISPDLKPSDLNDIARLINTLGIEGVIATNTTVSRPGSVRLPIGAPLDGGLSGQPLLPLTLSVVSSLRAALPPQTVIVGCGGIQSGEDALQMRRAGADLIQVYSGLVFRGPKLVRELREVL